MPTDIVLSDSDSLVPPKDKYQLLKEEYHRIRDELTQARATIENYDHELRKRSKELRQASQYTDHLQKVSQYSKDFIRVLQNLIKNSSETRCENSI